MRSPTVPVFRLRFGFEEVRGLAQEYAYADDADVIRSGGVAKARGWFTRDEFLAIAEWKTVRSRSRCARNSQAVVHDATELALRTSDERLRIGVLTLLQGVDIATASVFLHLAHREPYPIIDIRALWSLGIDTRPAYVSFEFWAAYTKTCRDLAARAAVEMRTLDRALWQYSAIHQPRGGRP